MSHSPNRLVALVVGGCFALFGIASVVVGVSTGRLAGPDGELLAGVFATTVAFGALTLAAGAALILAAFRGIRASKIANIVAGALWLAVGYAGLFVIGTSANVLGTNAIVGVLLFGASTVQLAVGLGARRDVPATA